LLVGHNQALVPRALNVKELDDGTGARAGNLQDLLVDVARVLGSFLEEALVADDVDVGLAGRRVGVLKLALVDEVASQLLVLAAGQRCFRAEALDAVCGVCLCVQVLFVDALLVLRAANDGDTGLASVDVDGMVGGLLVESDVGDLVVAGVGGDLGGVERVDVVDNAGTG
jgi:hypothetical protein